MQVFQNVRQHVWLCLLILVLGSNTILYRTEFGTNLLIGAGSGVVLGSLFDLVIITPLLFLAWNRKMSVKMFVVLMASGLVLARFLIPMKYLEPFVAITWLGIAVEAALVILELLLIVTLFRYIPKIVKATNESTIPLIFAFPKAVNHYVKQHQIVHIICSEMLMFYYAFASWRKKTPSGNTLTLHKKSSYIAFQIMLIHAIIIETIGFHWWLHDKAFILSIILLILNVYTVVFILADIQALRLNPLQIQEDRFYISMGLIKRMEVRWDDIDQVITDKDRLEQKLTNDTIEFIARDFDEVHPNIILKLKEPKQATLIMGIKKPYQKIAIKLDDFQRFYDALLKYRS